MKASVIALAAGLMVMAGTAGAAVQWAGTRWVDLDARNFDGVGVWTNNGTLCATFATGWGTLNNPVRETVAGVTAVTFDGGSDGVDKNQSVDRLESWVSAPDDITAAGDWTVEMWAYNPAAAAEECVVHWGRRGGPGAGSNAQLNYGSSADFGAAGHWGAPDMGYDPLAPVGQWQYVALTYDGTTERLYVDGVLNNAEAKTLAIHGLWNGSPNNVIIGAAWNNPNYLDTLAFSGSLAVVRVHGGALTAEQVRDNYRFEAARFGRPASPVLWAGKSWVELQAGADAVTNAAGDVTTWINRGWLAGDFVYGWGALNNPRRESVGGAGAVTFDRGADGADKNQSVDRLECVGPATPADLTGASDWSVEAWAYNPSFESEEPLLMWSARGGPDGSAGQLNFSSSPDFGASTHWGWMDMGYNPPPSAGAWHHLVLTYDGVRERLYVDGALNNSEAKALNLHGAAYPPTSWMIVGAAYQGGFLEGLAYAGSLAVLRVHGGVLTDEQVITNHDADAIHFGRFKIRAQGTVFIVR